MPFGRPPWRLAARLLRGRIDGDGPAADCDGSCCRHGAYVSLAERDRILAHAPGIRRAMDDSQPRDVRSWFATRHHHDSDFPDGIAVGTRVRRKRCVFRRRDGLCAIHRYEDTSGIAASARLKPFYCRLFPLTTDGGRVDFDPLIAGRRPCCSLARGGCTPALRAWREELRLVLDQSRTGTGENPAARNASAAARRSASRANPSTRTRK
jgi:hypothetical protein